MVSNETFYYEKEIANKIITSDCIVIYGAGTIAREVAYCLTREPYNCLIKAFMVTSKVGNPYTLMETPVITIDEGKDIYHDALIIVSVVDIYVDEIRQNLKKSGYYNVIWCNFEGEIWSGIRGNFFRSLFIQKYGKYLTPENLQETDTPERQVHIYSARSHVDRELKHKRNFPGEISIQAGADLTNKKICSVCDNTGDNISKKNKMYCELTALYWIWKNESSGYIGLDHYRRHFALDETDIKKLGKSDIDLVLTIPILNHPNVRTVYEYVHVIDDWDVMLQAIKVLCPDYLDATQEVQYGIYYYPYNMMIARKEVFNKYCEWLFPILKWCEEKCKPKDDPVQGRNIGYLAERLMTIYIVHHRPELKIIHVKKEFLS